MTAMVYEWGSGSRFSVDPQVVGETVEQLAVTNGGVCPPAALVDAARPSTSPLHKIVFALDPAQAAEAHYRQTARTIINSLRVVTDQSAVRPAAFVHVKLLTADGPREGYKPFYDVIADDQLRADALMEALQYLNGFRRRYRHLKELAPIFAVIDGLAAMSDTG